ncbi:MAG: hypothetical protein QXD44_03265 [Candidatus Nezhaarchaeales archaeon]
MKAAVLMRLQLAVDLYDLDLSLTPSFVSSVYERKAKGEWVKVAGYLSGKLMIKQLKPSKLLIKCLTDQPKLVKKLVEYELGLWHEPFEHGLDKLPRSVRSVLVKLASAYPGLRLPISYRDQFYIFVAVVLSRRANYDRWVLKWCKRIWRLYDGRLEALINADRSELTRIGSSYQVMLLPTLLKGLLEAVRCLGGLSSFLKLDPNLARALLIKRCKGIGPKLSDSFVLSVFKAPHIIPCDVHLVTVASRMGLIGEAKVKLPSKPLCSKYVCSEKASSLTRLPVCPRTSSCVRSRLQRMVGELGGWLQTITYLHGRSYCRTLRPKCNVCPMREDCKGRP